MAEEEEEGGGEVSSLRTTDPLLGNSGLLKTRRPLEGGVMTGCPIRSPEVDLLVVVVAVVPPLSTAIVFVCVSSVLVLAPCI